MIDAKRVHRYCSEGISRIENYDKAINDKTQIWDCHHRLEMTLDGEFAHSKEELKRLGMYYNRPYFELIFLPHSEHTRIHNKGISAETRAKMSEAKKGKPKAVETRAKMSEARRKYWEKKRANKE